MNDEIKEINIKIPGQILDYVDTKEHLLDLFNYITNLQQELQEANDNTEWWNNRYNAVKRQIDQSTNNWNKLEELIDAEKTRLAKECSHTYEDSLGKTKYVNEDIFNELNNILDKMKEIKDGNNEG